MSESKGKLVGPKEVLHSWVVDGVRYRAENGTVTPEPPDNHIDQQLLGMGFHREEASTDTKEERVTRQEPMTGGAGGGERIKR